MYSQISEVDGRAPPGRKTQTPSSRCHSPDAVRHSPLAAAATPPAYPGGRCRSSSYRVPTLLSASPVPDRGRVDVQQRTHIPTRSQLRVAVLTQPVLVQAHRAGTGLIVELPGADIAPVSLLDQEPLPRPGRFTRATMATRPPGVGCKSRTGEQEQPADNAGHAEQADHEQPVALSPDSDEPHRRATSVRTGWPVRHRPTNRQRERGASTRDTPARPRT